MAGHSDAGQNHNTVIGGSRRKVVLAVVLALLVGAAVVVGVKINPGFPSYDFTSDGNVSPIDGLTFLLNIVGDGSKTSGTISVPTLQTYREEWTFNCRGLAKHDFVVVTLDGSGNLVQQVGGIIHQYGTDGRGSKWYTALFYGPAYVQVITSSDCNWHVIVAGR